MNKNRTRYLHLVFSGQIQAYDIPKFRAAVIEKTKRESDLFHNHIESDKFIYRYPLIQYKVTDKKASLVCLNEATDDIHYLLKQKSFDFMIGGKNVKYEIDDVRLKYETIQTWDTDFTYNIHNWIAFNQENFKKYQELEGMSQKLIFLEEMLKKHIMIFMEAVEANEPIPLKVIIEQIKEEKYIEYKGVFHLTFSINFISNLTMPNLIGLGKGVSVGFGIVKRLSNLTQTSRYQRKKVDE